MNDAIEPDPAALRRRESRRTVVPMLSWTTAVGLLIALSGGCQTTQPSPVTASPAGSASPSASAFNPTPSGPAATGSPPSNTPPTASGVFIELVELAAEDPSPGGTYIVIGSSTAAPTDIGCWRLSTVTREDLRFPAGSTVPAGGGLRLSFDRGTVANPDRLTLRDQAGQVIDSTPVLNDTAGDDQLFGRVGDGWVFGRPPLPSPLEDGGFIATGGC